MIPAHRKGSYVGEVLEHEFLKPLEMPVEEFAYKTKIDIRRIKAIIAGETNITPEEAKAFADVFGTTDKFWLNLNQPNEYKLVQFETSTADVQRLKCMCGETVCKRCGHRMTQCFGMIELDSFYCPKCGAPFRKMMNG